MVTNHIAASEPARVQARAAAIELLARVMDLRHEMRTGGRALEEAQRQIRALISLMRLLSVSGFVSMQNTEVLIEALDELGHILERSQRSALAEHVVLKSEDFIVTDSITDTKRTRADTPNLTATTDSASDASKRTGMRSDSILSVLKRRGMAGIKDISAELPEYSEKMIQRELVRLVSDGRVLKTGSKRWSTYSPAPATI